jgi:hypothetical protein
MARLKLCEAETDARSATAIDHCLFPPDHAELVSYLTVYGNALRTNARPKDSLSLFTRAIAIAESSGTIDGYELAFARGYHALALHAVNPKDPRAATVARAAKAALVAQPSGARLVEELTTTFPSQLR